ncbi:ubiquitin 3 binding protein But2 C-terminal domain-containing protein [Microdochium trichocladiopsis]|uniref:Ubiquitin 3 binding protein But2 C-terminal domain-containing protein n=1 Tax=Microdochium trichocladiopsis TaxID=1682393 RepID=A0A9P8XWM6_9PEZI|nr:ubiquitin 3 binding protein But2 C-terminal domain-containing protein [Microdochium trichocladiopsis]KAH7018349.1 ubiquitin 3 binding protein But2 C-terminal domain-containing protein [Microdochium trichocladiopsis]
MLATTACGRHAVFVLLVILVQQCCSMVVRQNAGCGFHLQTNGSVQFPVGELASGQARAGSDIKPTLFTWFGDAFVDQQGRGCWWTRQMPDHDHEINCDGQLSFRGQTTFYECETGEGDQVNIYTVPSGVRCNFITLFADDCHSDCNEGGQAPAPFPTYQSPSSSLRSTQGLSTLTSTTNVQSPSSTSSVPLADSLSVTSQASMTGATASTRSPSASTASDTGTSPTDRPPAPTAHCALNLEGLSESPHLMVPVDSGHPDQSYGPSYYGQISQNASTFYNFDIPASDAGKTCTLFFDFPYASFTSTGYMWSGTGKLSFEQMRGPAISNTTYNSRPDVFMEIANLDIEPGENYVVNTFPCPAGERVTYQIREDHVSSNAGDSDSQHRPDTCLYYLQEHKPVPMGLFISKC